MISRYGRRSALASSLAGALLLLSSGFEQPAQAQYYQYPGYGFPFFNPWFFNRPAPEQRAPRQYRQEREHPHREYARPPGEYVRPHREHEAEDVTPPSPQKSDVTPAKTGVVIGDSTGEWLAYGIEQAYAESHDIGIVRRVQSSQGLIDECKGQVRKWLEQSLANEKPAFIAIMLGMNDRRSMHACGASGKTEDAKPGPYAFRSKEWEEAYGKQVDEAISFLKSKGVPVFWVGLPPARNVRAADLGMLNEIYREHAEKDGIGYVDVWEGFVDEDGDFTMRGPDVNGQIRRLRTADGLNFTKAGARKLAFNLEQQINRVVLYPAPVEAPAADARGTPEAAKPNQRPVAGPVVPLNGVAKDTAGVLLGSGKPSRFSPDAPLLGGKPAEPAPGRADDFSWPRPEELPAYPQQATESDLERPGHAQAGVETAPRKLRNRSSR
jgi:uncharacterized protein